MIDLVFFSDSAKPSITGIPEKNLDNISN